MQRRRFHKPFASLSLECLEPRLPLAGNITAVVSGNTLKITGDAEDNQVSIAAVVGDNTQFEVTSSTGAINTNINSGDVFTTPTGVKNIVINLLNGDDRVDFLNTPVGVSVPGNVTINGGNGANRVDATELSVLKNLSITNGTNETGFDQIELGDLNVGGNVAIKNGNGNTETFIFRNSPGDSTIGGNLSITNGVGEDDNQLVDTNVGKNVTIKNGKGAANGTAGRTWIYNSENTTERSVIGGNVTVSYSDGDGAGTEQNGIWDTEVKGNVVFNNGKGEFRTDFDGYSVTQPVQINGNLTIKGSGKQTVVTGQEYEKTGLEVGKNFSVVAKGAADLVSLDKLQVAGKVNLNLGDGENRVEIVAAGDSSAKEFSVTGGKDKDTVQFDAQLAAQKLTLNLKDGDNVFNSTVGIAGNVAATERAAISVNLGKGDDTVNLTNVLASNVNFKLGHGQNGLFADAVNALKASLSGGKNVDTVSLQSSQINDLSVSLGAGDDFLTALDSVFANSLNLDGGPGTDTLVQTNVTLPANPAKIKVKNIP